MADGPSPGDYYYDRTFVPRYAEAPPFPLEVLIDPTSFCNHLCAFCSNPGLELKATVSRDLALRFLAEARALGARRLGVFGTGEPFLAKDLPEYVRKAKTLGYEYAYLKTNGSLCDAARGAPVLDAGLDSLRFSIHAGTREGYRAVQGRDDFEKVVANLRWADAHRREKGLSLKTAVSFVLTDRGAPELAALKALVGACVDEWDVQELNSQCGNLLDNGTKGRMAAGGPRYDAAARRCKLPFSGVSLTPEGFVTACVMDFSGSLIVGDLAASSLKDIWEGPVYRSFRRDHLAGSVRAHICHACLTNEPTDHRPLMPELSRAARAAADAAR